MHLFHFAYGKLRECYEIAVRIIEQDDLNESFQSCEQESKQDYGNAEPPSELKIVILNLIFSNQNLNGSLTKKLKPK